ncbi:MAG TPA: hypothetical protein DCR93_04110 [Cytophagales bacterium]|nr:hypothetical protein [Cytophagales bacterium]
MRAGEGQLYVKEQDYFHLRFEDLAYVNLSGTQEHLKHLNQGTISLWFCPSQEPPLGHQILLYIGNPHTPDPTTLQFGIAPWTQGKGEPALFYSINRNGAHYSPSAPLTHNHFIPHHWYHLAISVSAQSLSMYVDGVEFPTIGEGHRPLSKSFIKDLWEGNQAAPDRFFLGRRDVPAGRDMSMDGALDELAIFNTPLDREQIKAIYQAGRETDLRTIYTTELEAYWKLGEQGEFPTVHSVGRQDLVGEFIGSQHPSPLQKETRQSLMFQDGQGQETPITQQKGTTQAGQLWGQKGENLYFNEGKVGIGTEDPEARLHVAGLARLHQYQGARWVWVATGNGPNEEVHFGKITSRVLRFQKYQAETALLIRYSDTFRAKGISASQGRWTIKIDDLDAKPAPIYKDYYAFIDHGQFTEHHFPGSIQGTAHYIGSGEHEISIWVGDTSNTAGERDRYTGWSNSTWMIEVEEVMLHQLPSP